MHLFEYLMDRRRSPYGRKADGSLIAVGPFHYAYHFDQALVGRYLRSKSSGIALVDGTVAGVEKDPATGNITALRLEEGGTIAGDFFIDATGFRKRLIGQEMAGRWHSYRAELPVNRAMPFWLDIAEGAEIAPYTLAWAREAGWLWSIPTQTRYGCGYVYCDEFKTPDEAKAEVETALGRTIEPRNDIRFDIGRLERTWIGNCLAVGLSSSFLEPLEATSIHGTVVQMLMFAAGFLKDVAQATDKDRADYNSRVARQVDDFRTFINTHYVTEREDTPFWRFVRNQSIGLETRARIEHWRHEMPRHEHFERFLGGLPHVEAQLHYPVLDGLGLLDPGVAKAEMAALPEVRAFARKSVDSLIREYKQASLKALGHAEYLTLARAGG